MRNQLGFFPPKKLITDIIKGFVASFGICQPWEPLWPGLSSLFGDDEGDDGSGSREKFLSELLVPIAGLLSVFGFSSWFVWGTEHPPHLCELPHLCVNPSSCGSGGQKGEKTQWLWVAAVTSEPCRVTLLESGLEHLDVTAFLWHFLYFLHGKAEWSLRTQLPGR